jgi:beta-glucanase (GH16 family)
MNRRSFVSAAAGALGLAGLTACSTGPSGSAISYAFSDDFDGPAGSAPDPSKWTYDLGGGGWGNDELEVYTASRANSFLDGHGNLVIRATRNVQGSGGQAVTSYRSARLKTLGRFSKYCGTFEARIKLDVQSGLWPAWWMLGANYPTVGWPACGEIDMLENYGPTATTSVHTPDDARTGVLTQRTDVAIDDGWHTWRLWWDRSSGDLSFYKDGARYMTVEPSQLANWCFGSGVPMFMILNLAVGGIAGIPPGSVRFPVDLLVDYVRVWLCRGIVRPALKQRNFCCRSFPGPYSHFRPGRDLVYERRTSPAAVYRDCRPGRAVTHWPAPSRPQRKPVKPGVRLNDELYPFLGELPLECTEQLLGGPKGGN